MEISFGENMESVTIEKEGDVYTCRYLDYENMFLADIRSYEYMSIVKAVTWLRTPKIGRFPVASPMEVRAARRAIEAMQAPPWEPAAKPEPALEQEPVIEKRIGDRERNKTLDLLSTHFQDGRIGYLEWDERSTKALAATTQPELRALLEDLPAIMLPKPEKPEPAVPVPPAKDTWRSFVSPLLIMSMIGLAIAFVILVAVSQ